MRLTRLRDRNPRLWWRHERRCRRRRSSGLFIRTKTEVQSHLSHPLLSTGLDGASEPAARNNDYQKTEFGKKTTWTADAVQVTINRTEPKQRNSKTSAVAFFSHPFLQQLFSRLMRRPFLVPYPSPVSQSHRTSVLSSSLNYRRRRYFCSKITPSQTRGVACEDAYSSFYLTSCATSPE